MQYLMLCAHLALRMLPHLFFLLSQPSLFAQSGLHLDRNALLHSLEQHFRASFSLGFRNMSFPHLAHDFRILML